MSKFPYPEGWVPWMAWDWSSITEEDRQQRQADFTRDWGEYATTIRYGDPPGPPASVLVDIDPSPRVN